MGKTHEWQARMDERGVRETLLWTSAPQEYQYLTLECMDYDGAEFTVSREQGLDCLTVELPQSSQSGRREFRKIDLDRLIALLSEAKRMMLHRYSENWDPREDAFSRVDPLTGKGI